MTREEMLFTLVAEESGELTQRATKIIRFGVDHEYNGKTNNIRFFEEFIDLCAVIEILIEEGYLDDEKIDEDLLLSKRKERIEKYLQVSKELGRLK